MVSDFSAWETAGYWDYRHTPFSYFEGDRVVASVSIYLLDAVIDGNLTKLVQISGVGTAPEYRRRGLNRELTEKGLAWAASHEPAGVFLFSDEDAIAFYRATGFEPIEEFVEYLPLKYSNPKPGSPVFKQRDLNSSDLGDQSGVRRLDLTRVEECDRIYQMARRRAPVSQRFSVMNAKLVMFHCLYILPESVFEIPELDCIVLAERESGVLRIHDLIARRMPTWEDLAGFLLRDEDREVEFCFSTDKLDLSGVQRRAITGNHPFVRPGFPVAEPVFPSTSRA